MYCWFTKENQLQKMSQEQFFAQEGWNKSFRHGQH
jgi:hypothetical protein